MNILLFKTSLRYLLRHPWQIGLSILGIALGVAVVVAIDIANTSAQRAFSLSAEVVTGQTTHQVVGSSQQGVDEALFRQLVLQHATPYIAPVVEGYVSTEDQQLGPLLIFGVDPFSEAGFRSFLGEQDTGTEDLTALLVQPNSGLISKQTAERAGLGVGSELSVVVNGQREVITIVGLIQPQDEAARRALDGMVITDIASAQEVLGRVGQLSRIDLILPDEPKGVAIQEQITQSLPTGVELVRPQTRTEATQQLSRAFEVNLTALSLLALVVGMFLIYNTVTFSVVQRRGLLGTLRCMGVTRREIFLLVLLESLAVGVVGSLIGVLIGIGLGRGLVALVTQTINDLYFVVTVRSLAITPVTLLKGIFLGIAATLLAATVPATEASYTPPRMVLRRSSVEERIRQAVPVVTGIALALLAVGIGILFLPSRSLWLSFAGLFGIIFGCALLTPLATLGLMHLLRPISGRVFGLLGRMAARDVVATLSRTSVAIAALMIAVSVTVGVGIMVGSFRQTVVTWLETSLRADIYVSPPGLAANRPDTTLDPEVVTTLRQAPNVVDSVRYRNIITRSEDRLVQVIGVDVNERHRTAYRLVSGSYDAAWEAFRGNNAVFVSEPFAYRFNVPLRGGEVTLQTDTGSQTFAVAGVFYDYASDQGVVVMPLTMFQRYWNDRSISSLALYVAPDADVDAVIEELRPLVAGQQEVLLQSNRGLREATLEIFDRTFAITSVLQILATIIAFIGILSALMALQLERARELGIMRANGLTPRQLWGVVLGQTGLMGFTAGLLALPVGWIVALVLVHVINRRSFGWTLEILLTPSVFVQALLLALIAAVLAGLYPALRMANTPPALALREE
jgi:putative ABC transport system permease protein